MIALLQLFSARAEDARARYQLLNLPVGPYNSTVLCSLLSRVVTVWTLVIRASLQYKELFFEIFGHEREHGDRGKDDVGNEGVCYLGECGGKSCRKLQVSCDL
jgi:hypothetical protein